MNLSYVEKSADTPSPDLLVLLHGYGSDEQDLLALGTALPRNWHVVSLRGPFSHPYGGHAWFSIEWYPDGTKDFDLAEARQSLDMLIADLDAWAQRFTGRRALGGFSQGAMMALSAAAKCPGIWDGLCLMSGRLVPESLLLESELPPTLAQHGTEDEVIPIEEGRELAAWLRQVRPDADCREYAMGHQISPESYADWTAWLERIPRAKSGV